MYKNKKILGLICARGGSTGVPGKNIKDFHGLPMIAWAIKKLLHIEAVDKVVVNTDSPKIAEIARSYGAETPFIREAALAQNDTPMLPVIRDCIRRMLPETYDSLILAQANSPLSRQKDMVNGIHKLIDENLDVVFSVTKCSHPPEWTIRLTDNTPVYAFPGYASERPACRQENPPLYRTTGAFSCAKVSHIMNGDFVQLCLPAPEQKSGVIITDFESGIDIDSFQDYMIANALAPQNLP